MLQWPGAGRAACAHRIRPDDHLRDAGRAQSRPWGDVHARRLCRLGRLFLFRVLHRRGDRRLAVRDGVGLLMERLVIRHFYARPGEDQLLVTFGLGIVFVETVRFVFGSLSKTVPPPALLTGTTPLGFMVYPTYRLALLGIVTV